MFGQNVCNTGSSPTGAGITKANVAKLKTKWTFNATGEVSATPAVVDGSVYITDWGGMISRLDAQTGNVTWTKSITTLVAGQSNLQGFLSRSTPLVTNDSVIFGTGRGGQPGLGAFLVSIDKNTAAVKWVTPLHEGHPGAVITSSPVYDGKRLYFGVASQEEGYNQIPGYQCCSFRGSVVAVDATTGSVVWQTHTISDKLYFANGVSGALSGYAGGAVWSSTPVLDFKRMQLYATTGNNYTAPNGAPGTADGDYVDSILALDIETGAVKWAQSVPQDGVDVYTIGGSSGPDSDFGAGANLFTANVHGVSKDLVGAGQKSGMYYALDADTGKVVWQTQVGPGGHLGGIHWGTATDGIRIYIGDNNANQLITLGGKGPQAGKTVDNGAWAALDPATGDILWQVVDPALSKPLNGATVNGPVAAVNGVLFAGSMDANGTMFALDAATGDVLWSFQSGGTVYSRPAVAGGVVYWGSGYPTRLGYGTSSKKLYAFAPAP